jgi:hypothetical protein
MPNRVNGKVTRIYPNEDGCYIRMNYAGDKPKDEYFHLSKTHGNYNSLYSLAVVAAVNRYTLSIRTRQEIVSTEHGEVVYMVVDW